MSRLARKHSSIGWLCLGVLLFGFSAVTSAQSSDNAYDTRSTLGSADGQAIFQRICQGCHMPDAKGAVGAGAYPALTSNPRLISPQYMAAVILHGRRDMPSFIQTGDAGPLEDAKLSDAQIAGVINFIRTHFGNHYTDRITAQDVAGMHP